MPQRVILLCRGVRLGAELLALFGEERAVKVIRTPLELAKSPPPADVVVVDVPAQDRGAVCQQVRRHYHGPLIVLLDLGDNSHDLPPDRSRTLLTRPFSFPELSAALAAATPTQSASDPASQLRLFMRQGVQDRQENSSLATGRGTVAQAILRLPRSWRERRVVRVSVISITAVLLFVGAFALVNQSGRCGPGCDELTGVDLTFPSTTTIGAVGAGPYGTDPGVGVVGSTRTEPSVGPTADEGSRSDGDTSRISTTTAWASGTPASTSPPESTRPQTTAPSPTASKTTASRTSTSTTATTSTTTTTTTFTTTTGP